MEPSAERPTQPTPTPGQSQQAPSASAQPDSTGDRGSAGPSASAGEADTERSSSNTKDTDQSPTGQAEQAAAGEGSSRDAPSADAGSQQAAGPQIDQRLYGTWQATDVSAPVGEVRIRLIFARQGTVDIAAWSELPLVGQVRDKQAPLVATGPNKLHSDAIRDGTTVQYRFTDAGQLVIEYGDGKTVTFTRQDESK